MEFSAFNSVYDKCLSWNIKEIYVGCLGVELYVAKSGQGLGPHGNVAVLPLNTVLTICILLIFIKLLVL